MVVIEVEMVIVVKIGNIVILKLVVFLEVVRGFATTLIAIQAKTAKPSLFQAKPAAEAIPH